MSKQTHKTYIEFQHLPAPMKVIFCEIKLALDEACKFEEQDDVDGDQLPCVSFPEMQRDVADPLKV